MRPIVPTLVSMVLLAACPVARAADDPAAAIQAELARFQGTWQLVSAETNGEKAPEDRVKMVRVVIKGSTHSVHIGDQIVAHDVSFVIDPTTQPKQTTDTINDGPDKGKEIRGIYRLEGDILMSCVGPVGGERPKAFATQPDSGQSLRVFRRVTEEKPTSPANVAAELKAFEGSWRFQSMILQGRDITATLNADDRLILKGDHFTSKTREGTVEGTFKVDTTVNPKTIDIILELGPGRTHRIQGIYTLEGDTYTICSALPGKPRPTSFKTSPGSGSSVQVMKRDRP